MGGTPLLLLVEDNPADVTLVQRAVRDLPFDVELKHAADGEQGLRTLVAALASIGEGPALVLLDLNLPGMSGFDVLRQLKQHVRTRCIPVVVLSSSDRDTDVHSALAGHANLYVQKATNLDAYLENVRQVPTTFLGLGAWQLESPYKA